LAFPGKVLATNAGLFIADSGHHRIVMSSENGEILHLIGTGKPGLTDGSFQRNFLHLREWHLIPKINFFKLPIAGSHQIWEMNLQTDIVKTYQQFSF
jgi:hypothetical protein